MARGVEYPGRPGADTRQRVLDPFGQAIAGLYVAGELGSIWAVVRMYRLLRSLPVKRLRRRDSQ